MKKIKLLLVAGACVVLSACSPQAPTVHTTDKGTQWEWNEGTIVVKSPERPAGQKSVIGLTAPKMEVVRVGFVGLGMRGPGACGSMPEHFKESFYAESGNLLG